jgi:hypothetical protein
MSQPSEPPRVIVRALELLVVLGALFRRRPAARLPEGVSAEDLAAGYEHSDINPAVVGAAAVGLLILLALAVLAVTFFGQLAVGIPFTVSRPADLINGLQAAPAPTPPSPALEAQSGQTLDPYRTIEQQKLNSYGWVDRSGGVVRIPIDRAMQLTAQQGLPSRPAGAATPQDSGATSPSVASSGRMEESYP